MSTAASTGSAMIAAIILLLTVTAAVAAASPSVLTSPICTLSDFQLQNGKGNNPSECTSSSKVRTLTYENKNSQTKACVGPSTLTLSASCECALDEYYHYYSVQCNNTEAAGDKDGKKLCQSDSPVVETFDKVLQNFQNGVKNNNNTISCECTEGDIGSSYTDCDANKYQKQVIYYWKRPCSSGGAKLPFPKTVSCETTCSAGQFIAPPHHECQQCPQGTFSIPGSSFGAPWLRWPLTFHSSCSTTTTSPSSSSECVKWSLGDGTAIHSGDQTSASTISSSLFITATLKTSPAVLSLRYRVSSEMYGDNFAISLDNVPVFARSGEMVDYETISLDLEEEGYTCKWKVKTLAPNEHLVNNNGACLERNMFHPYSRAIHFDRHHRDLPYVFDVFVPKDYGCSASDYSNNSTVKGTLAVIPSVGCNFYEKAYHAQQAGAAAVLIVQHWAANVRMGGDLSHVKLSIPTASIPEQDGLNIINSVRINRPVRVYIDRDGNNEDGTVVTKREIELTYNKDFTVSRGEDKVYVSDISISGTEFAATECQQCPPGYSTEQTGSDKCVACPANTFSKSFGDLCEECPPHTISGPGSTTCTQTTTCTQEDYVPRYSPCFKNDTTGRLERVLSYHPVDPPMCDYAHSTFVVEPPRTVECAPCSLAAVRVNEKCQQCALGSVKYYDMCVPCQNGSAVLLSRSFDGFDSLEGTFPNDWQRSCEGCLSNKGAWFLLPHKEGTSSIPNATDLVTGRGMGDTATAFLRIPLTMVYPGSVHIKTSMTFATSADGSTVDAHLFVTNTKGDSVRREIVLNHTISDKATVHVFPVSEGSHMLVIRFRKHRVTHVPVLLRIHVLDITGDSLGGSMMCLPCPAGYECLNGIPKPCPVGSHSISQNDNAQDGTSCVACHQNSFSATTGNDVCQKCPSGTFNLMRRDACFFYPTPKYNDSLSYNFTTFAKEELQILNGKQQLILINLGIGEALRGTNHVLSNRSGNRPYAYMRATTEDDMRAVSLGSELSVSPPTPSTNTNNDFYAVTIHFRNGDRCDTNRIVNYSLDVRFECHPGLSVPYEAKVTLFDGCHVDALVQSPYACPLCNAKEHFMKTESEECNSEGKYYETWSYRSASRKQNCFGGDEMPSVRSEEISCSAARRHIVAFGGLIVVAALCVVFLLCVCGFVWYQRRKIYNEYAMLASNIESSDHQQHRRTDENDTDFSPREESNSPSNNNTSSGPALEDN
eukprot:PhM_4_TR1290/c0_g1_i1/m.58298